MEHTTCVCFLCGGQPSLLHKNDSWCGREKRGQAWDGFEQPYRPYVDRDDTEACRPGRHRGGRAPIEVHQRPEHPPKEDGPAWGLKVWAKRESPPVGHWTGGREAQGGGPTAEATSMSLNATSKSCWRLTRPTRQIGGGREREGGSRLRSLVQMHVMKESMDVEHILHLMLVSVSKAIPECFIHLYMKMLEIQHMSLSWTHIQL
jgi:hypothetical protein